MLSKLNTNFTHSSLNLFEIEYELIFKELVRSKFRIMFGNSKKKKKTNIFR